MARAKKEGIAFIGTFLEKGSEMLGEMPKEKHGAITVYMLL